MANEQEQSLQKRPELVPERLMRGGLIVGVEPAIQGSLMSVTGAAIERITRERTEVPPQFKLPERPVYFLDPNTRRLIMISNRENRGENKTPDKYGLFAEIVELDEEGKPHYRLSSSEIILPDDNYHLVAVGPNSFGLPPSHIDVVEEEEGGKKKFVPWNLWLGTLQNWMNELKIGPNEDFEMFIKRFTDMRSGSEFDVKSKVQQAFFTDALQGINEKTAPINIIIDSKGIDSELINASFDAGIFPVHIDAKLLAEYHDELGGWIEAELQCIKDKTTEDLFSVNQFLPGSYFRHQPAVLTLDFDDTNNFKEEQRFEPLHIAREFQKYNTVFSLVIVRNPESFSGIRKREHGSYMAPRDEEQYRGLLNKLKADLLLTMFLRGGAPIVK